MAFRRTIEIIVLSYLLVIQKPHIYNFISLCLVDAYGSNSIISETWCLRCSCGTSPR